MFSTWIIEGKNQITSENCGDQTVDAKQNAWLSVNSVPLQWCYESLIRSPWTVATSRISMAFLNRQNQGIMLLSAILNINIMKLHCPPLHVLFFKQISLNFSCGRHFLGALWVGYVFFFCIKSTDDAVINAWNCRHPTFDSCLKVDLAQAGWGANVQIC